MVAVGRLAVMGVGGSRGSGCWWWVVLDGVGIGTT